MKQNRKLAVAEDNSKNTGDVGEEVAACALELAGFRVFDLNKTIRLNFTFADLLAERNGVWYVISVKSRNKHTNDGRVKNCYKLRTGKMSQAIEEIRQVRGVDAVPAFVAVEFDGKTYSAYFGKVSEQQRKNGIGMRAHETARYECLANNRPHHRRIAPNKYRRISDVASGAQDGTANQSPRPARAKRPYADLVASRAVGETTPKSAKEQPSSKPSVPDGKWRHLNERCGPETSDLLQTLTEVIAKLFPDVEVEWGRKLYVSYLIDGKVWLYVRTYPSSLRLLCRVDAATFDQAKLARRLAVRELDGDESHADKLALGSSVSVGRETASTDKVLLRMKEDFNARSDGFLQFLKDAHSSWAQRDKTNSRSEVQQT